MPWENGGESLADVVVEYHRQVAGTGSLRSNRFRRFDTLLCLLPFCKHSAYSPHTHINDYLPGSSYSTTIVAIVSSQQPQCRVHTTNSFRRPDSHLCRCHYSQCLHLLSSPSQPRRERTRSKLLPTPILPATPLILRLLLPLQTVVSRQKAHRSKTCSSKIPYTIRPCLPLTCPRQIRNVNKKLSSSAKADAVLAENPGKSLDELVASKKLNNDQKAQIEKKPGLKAQLAQLEEQVTNYRAFAQEADERFAHEKAAMIEAHEAEVKQLKEEAATSATAAQGKDLDDALKVIVHFLHAAASKRQSEDTDSDEARAFEGALLLVYQGNEAALSTFRNLIEGSNDRLTDTAGEHVDYTFAQIKQAALAEAETSEELPEVEAEAPAVEDSAPSTDPTVANAGLTELQDTTAIPIHTNGVSEVSAIPEQASTGDDAANAVAESRWDPESSMHSAGEGWVNVPRDPAETDTGLQATPAAPAAQAENSNSWADDVPEESKPLNENDGFEQVKGRHTDNRGRGRGRGGRGDGFRGGRGGRGGARGEFRGGRGRGGDRGRGGFRGDRG
jgi:hypothetical protein